MKKLASKAADYMRKTTQKTQSRERGALWTHIEQKRNDGLEARRPYEQHWLLNLAFLAGRQYVFFNSSAHSIQGLNPVRGRIRMMDNQLMPRVRRQIADFIKNDPIMSVVPCSTQDEDIQAAKAGDKFLQSFWRSNRLKKKIRQQGSWIYATGNAFLDHRWNRKLGPINLDEGSGKMVYSGDVDVGVWSPFEIIVPFTAMGNTDIHGFEWMIKNKWRSIDYIRDNYPEFGDMVQEEQMSSSIMDSSWLTGGSTGTQARKFPGAMLMEYYHKPGGPFPQGLFCACANGVILDAMDFPFNKYNVEHFKDIEVPGQFHGKATMQDAIPLQKTWNSTLSDMHEFNRTMGRGKYLVPKGSGMTIEFDNVTGQHVHYKPVMGLKPELLSMKNMPASFGQVLEITFQSFNGLFSQHEVTQGTNKSDIRSGEMVAILREQDAHGVIPAHAIFEESLEELMQGVLKRVQKGYDQPRMIEVVGRDDELAVMSFSAADLRNNTDVKVKKQSSLPDSRIAREARIMERFQQGLYGHPEDPEVRRHVMNMLEDAVVKDIYDQERKDEAVARWENQLIAQGVALPINNYDNHMVHAKEHASFQKQLDYQKLKVNDQKAFGEMEARFLQHQMAHQKFVEEQRAAMMAEQEKMKGGKSK